MKINVTKGDVIWNYIGTIINLCGNFMILPFLLYYLDGDMYGLWNVFLSVGGIVALFDFGFNATFARNITYCWSGAKSLHKQTVEHSEDRLTDYDLFKKILITCQRIYFIISITAFIILLVAGTAYISYIGRNVSGIQYIVAWFIYATAVFLNLYYGYYDSFLRGIGAIAEVNRIKIAARFIQIVLVIILLAMKWGIIGASTAYLVYGLSIRLMSKRTFNNYDGIKDKVSSKSSKIEKNELKELFLTIWYNAWREGLVSLANYLSNQATVFISSIYLSLSETGIYSLSVQLTQAVVMIASALYGVYQPTLQAAYVERNSEKIKNSMSAILISYIIAAILGFVFLYIIAVPAIRFIKPSATLNPIVILGVGVYQVILKFRNCYTSYLSSTNRVIYAKAFVISGILCVAFSVLLEEIFKMGVWGLIVAQIISQLVYNAWRWPLLVHKELAMPIKEIIPRGIKEITALVLASQNAGQ